MKSKTSDLIVIVLMIITLIGAFYSIGDKQQEIKKLTEEINTLNKTIENQETKYQDLDKAYLSLQKELYKVEHKTPLSKGDVFYLRKK